MTLGSAFDMAYLVKLVIQLMTGKCIPLAMIKDSPSVHKIFTKTLWVTEKRLMSNLKSI